VTKSSEKSSKFVEEVSYKTGAVPFVLEIVSGNLCGTICL
jgi:hypothetical protein